MLLDLRSQFESSSGAVTYSYTGSGGITFGGAAAVKEIWTYAVSGGIVFGGQDAEKFLRTYPVAAAGIVFSGSSGLKDVQAYAASGGIVFGGAASLRESWTFAVSGGVVFGGSATTVFTGASTFVYAGSGGITFGGTASTIGPTPVVVQENARTWPLKRHAAARSSSSEAVSAVAFLFASTDSSTTLSTIEAVADVGTRTVSATEVALLRLSSALAETELASVTVAASATFGILPSSAASTMSNRRARGSSVVRGSQESTALSAVAVFRVAIGPNLRQREEDDLLLLLEAA